MAGKHGLVNWLASPCTKQQEKQMTKEEALDALNESGVDYEVVAEHDYGYHIIVKFEKEEE